MEKKGKAQTQTKRSPNGAKLYKHGLHIPRGPPDKTWVGTTSPGGDRPMRVAAPYGHTSGPSFARQCIKCPGGRCDGVPPNIHYYRLIYRCCHFHYLSDRSDGVILLPSVGTIARPPRIETGILDFYHRWVNDRCDSGIRVAFAPSHEKPSRLGYAIWPSALN